MKHFFFLILFIITCSMIFTQDYDTIYAINFYDGISYSSTIVPYSAKEIYIQADNVNAFVVRETLLYYWPLTSEFKADWASRNVPVQGILCVSDKHGNIERINAQIYTIQYDLKDIPNTIRIYWGPEADKKHSEFTSEQQKYTSAVFAYNEALRLFHQEVTIYLHNTSGEFGAFPEMPVPPKDFTIMSNGVNIGFPVKLSKGSYTIYFEDQNGKIILSTKKRLIAFSHRERISGFQVFEEERWTVPSDFPDSKMFLYTVSTGTLYMQPFKYLHYDASEYNLMMNPQNRYNRNETSKWIPVSLNSEIEKLNIAGQELILLGYKVTQLAGSRLGYIINPVDFNNPDSTFSAFKMHIPQGSEGHKYNIGNTSAIFVLRIFRGIELVLIIVSLIPIFIYCFIMRKRHVS